MARLSRPFAVRLTAAALAAAGVTLGTVAMTTPTTAAEPSAHTFSFTAIDGAPMPMAQYAGKTVLLVNTASFCGYTGQYANLQSLWERYRDRGLVVIGVPSNNFGGQEPKDETAIQEFCEVNFAIDFPMTEKQTVVGDSAHPLYRWIADRLEENDRPRWNFFKYLISPDGQVLSGWSSGDKPDGGPLLAAIERALPPVN